MPSTNLRKQEFYLLQDNAVASRPTYTHLFRLLSELGFDKADPAPAQWTWQHTPSETVLLFSLEQEDSDYEVSEADLASVDAHLRGKGIITRPLQELLPVPPKRTSRQRQREV